MTVLQILLFHKINATSESPKLPILKTGKVVEIYSANSEHEQLLCNQVFIVIPWSLITGNSDTLKT